MMRVTIDCYGQFDEEMELALARSGAKVAMSVSDKEGREMVVLVHLDDLQKALAVLGT